MIPGIEQLLLCSANKCKPKQVLLHVLQEYNPDLTHNISKKEKSKKGSDGVMLTNVTAAVDHVQAEDQGR